MFLQGSGVSEAPIHHKNITKTFHRIKCRGVLLGVGAQKFSHDPFIWDLDTSSRHKNKTPALPNSGWNMDISSTQESTWPCLPWASQCWASCQPGAWTRVSHVPRTLLTPPPELLEESGHSWYYWPQELPILLNPALSLCIIWFQTIFPGFSITKFFNYPNLQTKWTSHHGYALYSTISRHLLWTAIRHSFLSHGKGCEFPHDLPFNFPFIFWGPVHMYLHIEISPGRNNCSLSILPLPQSNMHFIFSCIIHHSLLFDLSQQLEIKPAWFSNRLTACTWCPTQQKCSARCLMWPFFWQAA